MKSSFELPAEPNRGWSRRGVLTMFGGLLVAGALSGCVGGGGDKSVPKKHLEAWEFVDDPRELDFSHIASRHLLDHRNVDARRARMLAQKVALGRFTAAQALVHSVQAVLAAPKDHSEFKRISSTSSAGTEFYGVFKPTTNQELWATVFGTKLDTQGIPRLRDVVVAIEPQVGSMSDVAGNWRVALALTDGPAGTARWSLTDFIDKSSDPSPVGWPTPAPVGSPAATLQELQELADWEQGLFATAQANAPHVNS